MFKLYINNIQVGNYRTIHNMTNSVIMYCNGKNVDHHFWSGKSLYISTKQ